MKVIISQQDKKILITFKSGKVVDNYAIDKADGFINALDKFFRKSNIRPIGQIKFKNAGVLTERIIRATILGLRF